MVLTEQQSAIVNYDKLGTLIVKGTAGSGKSLVGLERVNYLFKRKSETLFSSKEDSPKILIITFNKIMFTYLKQFFKKIKDPVVDEDKVKFINIDKIMFNEAKKITDQSNYDILWKGNSISKSIIHRLNTQKDKYDDEFIISELAWIRNNYILEEEEYLNIVRLGRGKKKLNKADRHYIWSLLKEYRLELKRKNNIDVLDAYRLMINKSDFEKYKEYNHIIVDEAQDLSRLQLEFILKLNKNSLKKSENSLMFLYDTSQNIYDESWLGYGRSFAALGLDVKGKTKKLETSYRTTRQIHQAANSLVNFYKDKNLDEESKIDPVFLGNEEGIKPLLYKFEDDIEELETISKNIKALTEKIYKYKDIMIVSFSNSTLNSACKFLNSQGIPSYIFDGNKVEEGEINFNDNNVKLLTVHNAKGLENKVVFILNTKLLSKKKIFDIKDEEERHIRNSKKLYTAMTRAQELLFLSQDENYISKIDEKYLNKINNYKDTDLISILESNIASNEIFIETNKTDRFKEVRKSYKEKYEEEQKDEKKINELLTTLTKENITKEISLNETLKEKFRMLDPKIIDLILGAEELYTQTNNKEVSYVIYATIYLSYVKIIEIMLKNFLREIYLENDLKYTLGTILIKIKEYKYLNLFYSDMQKLNILMIRNDAVHEVSEINKNSVESLRKYLILDKRVIDLHNAIEKQKNFENQKNSNLNPSFEVNKEFLVSDPGHKIIINKNSYYTFLLNNDERAICKNSIKSGKYNVKGHYINTKIGDILLIKSYKKI